MCSNTNILSQPRLLELQLKSFNQGVERWVLPGSKLAFCMTGQLFCLLNIVAMFSQATSLGQ